MKEKPLVELVTLDYDKEGNLMLVFPADVFEAISASIQSGSYQKRDKGVRVAVSVGDLGYRLKSLRFLMESDLPPCDT